jgi:ubiquinone/menaquinone biosynthesis C-methylase UbiE
MQRHIFETLYRTEATYWWFVGQRFLIYHFLKKYYGSRSVLKLLDVGCGTGITLKLLKRFGDVVGIDIADDAVDFCKKRGFRIKKSDVMDLKLKSSEFDVVTSLGVFYHKGVTDDVQGFKEIYRVLKPGGRLFFFDCANKSLFGKHDIAFDGVRRYSRRELLGKLKKTGFAVEKISYVNALLFPLVYLSRKLGKLSSAPPKSEVRESINPIINSILKFVYKLELRGVSYFDYPFGVNIFAVGRKR